MTEQRALHRPEFFELQVTFARKITDVQGVALTELLMEWTILRQLLQLRVNPTTPNAVWTEYTSGVEAGDDPAKAAYALYVQRMSNGVRDTPAPTYWGCFHYAYPWRGETTVGMHFENLDSTDHGTLSRERMPARMSEIRAMFAHIRAAHPEAAAVRGSSWLYNIPAYQRLFPPEYVASAGRGGYETGFWALWGQFIARDGRPRRSTVGPFLDALRVQTTVDGCLNSFPYEVLKPRCGISVLYDFHGIEG